MIARYPVDPPPRWHNPVLAMGNFDGLHRGHAKIIDRVRRRAGERGGTSAALTFDPHPPRVVRPDKAPPLLMTTAQRLEALTRGGMQGVAVVAFTYEMSQVIDSHKGYVLKYVGDAVIAFFPASYNKLLACDRAVQCAKSMLTVVKNGINPILNQYDYPELNVKLGMDEGENVIVQYGHDKSSLIDILGYCMNIAAKITSLTGPNKISIGEDVHKMLHPSIQAKFKEVKFKPEEWKYTDRQTGKLYRVYAMSNAGK